MKVTVLEISDPRKESVLAHAKVLVSNGEGNTITIDDLRART